MRVAFCVAKANRKGGSSDRCRADWVGFAYQAGNRIPDTRKTIDGFKKLFEWARSRYERVIVDMPVIMVAPGVTEVGRAGGSVLLVHRPGRIPAPVLEQINNYLALARTHLAGVVLNAIQERWTAGHYLPAYYGASNGIELLAKEAERRRCGLRPPPAPGPEWRPGWRKDLSSWSWLPFWVAVFSLAVAWAVVLTSRRLLSSQS